jgi:hypothetical protein
MDMSYDVLWQALESEPQYFTLPLTYIFIFAITVFNTFLLLGLFVAVVTGTFKRVREMHIIVIDKDASGHGPSPGRSSPRRLAYPNKPLDIKVKGKSGLVTVRSPRSVKGLAQKCCQFYIMVGRGEVGDEAQLGHDGGPQIGGFGIPRRHSNIQPPWFVLPLVVVRAHPKRAPKS